MASRSILHLCDGNESDDDGGDFGVVSGGKVVRPRGGGGVGVGVGGGGGGGGGAKAMVGSTGKAIISYGDRLFARQGRK